MLYIYKARSWQAGKMYTNTNSNSNLNLNSTYKTMVDNNEIEYVLPGPNQEIARRTSAEIIK